MDQEVFKDMLRKKGLKVTNQRMLVLEIMAMKKSGTTWEELDLDDTCKSAAQSIVLYNNFLNGGNV